VCKISIRIRPFNEEEKKRDSSSPLENVDTKNYILTIKREYDKKNYSYDKIFPMTTDQISIFESTSKEVVKSVLAGYNVLYLPMDRLVKEKHILWLGILTTKKQRE